MWDLINPRTVYFTLPIFVKFTLIPSKSIYTVLVQLPSYTDKNIMIVSNHKAGFYRFIDIDYFEHFTQNTTYYSSHKQYYLTK